jgi:putative glutamine amidotransferase
MKNSPKIGLTTRLELNSDRFYLGRHYSEALENFGALPLHIGLIPKRKYISETLKFLDGVLLPGSDTDVDPLIYGEEPHKNLKKVVKEKDETDLLVLEEAEKLRMPILAICYGCQVLNVSRGGTLYQDIEHQIDNAFKHEQGIPLERNSHSISITKESRLARLITAKNETANELENETKVLVNSHHHQSIKQIGKNLFVTARANDSVVECIEDTRSDRFVMGVQWHPELSWRTDFLSKKIFEKFSEECRKFADGK